MTDNPSILPDDSHAVSILTASSVDASSRRKAVLEFSSIELIDAKNALRVAAPYAIYCCPRRALVFAEIAVTKFPDRDAVHVVCSALASLHVSVPRGMPIDFVGELFSSCSIGDDSSIAAIAREAEGGPSRRRVLRRASSTAYRAVLRSISRHENDTVLTVFLDYAEEALTAVPFARNVNSLSRFALRRAHAALHVAGSSCPETAWKNSRFVELITRLALLGGMAPLCPRPIGVPRDVVANSLIPLVDKALLREKDTALYTIPGLLYALRGTDFTDFAWKPFCKTAVDAVQSSSEVARERGIVIAAALASRVSSIEPTGLVDGVDALSKTLKTAKYAYQRLSAAKALVKICESVPDQVGSNIVLAALKGICTWVSSKKETNDEYRCEAARSLLDVFQAVMVHHSKKNSGSIFLENDLVETAQTLILDMVLSRRSEVERRSALAHLSSPKFNILSCFNVGSAFGAKLVDALVAVAIDASVSSKSHDSLCASSVLLQWICQLEANSGNATTASDVMVAIKPLLSKFNACVRDSKKSPVLHAASNRPLQLSLEDSTALIIACKCLLQLHFAHSAENESRVFSPDANAVMTDVLNNSVLHTAMACLVYHAVNQRREISQIALSAVGDLRKRGGDVAANEFLRTVWSVELGNSREAQDFMRSLPDARDRYVTQRKRLIRVLSACMLPSVPISAAPLLALAAHHPRTFDMELFPSLGHISRTWASLISTIPLELVENPDLQTKDEGSASSFDWIDSALLSATGRDGLSSGKAPLIESAIGALGGLLGYLEVRCSREFAISQFSRTMTLVRPFLQDVTKLAPDHFAALKTSGSFPHPQNDLTETLSRDEPLTTNKKSSRFISAKSATKTPSKGSESSSVKDRASEKSDLLADEANRTIRHASSALRALSSLCRMSPLCARAMTPTILSLVLPCAKIKMVMKECLCTLVALASVADHPLRNRYTEIATLLFGIETEEDVREAIFATVQWLESACDPPLSAEGFSLIAPIVREAMVREPRGNEANDRRGTARAEVAGIRRVDVAMASAGASVLRAHCQSSSIDAAIAAAAAKAGGWALTVLEREDAAFGPAADALAFLCGTALSPSSAFLSQVLTGIVSGKTSVREASLMALERIPALSQSDVACPRNGVLGRTLWLAMHDPESENAALAFDLWENYSHPLNVPEDAPALLSLLSHMEADVRAMTASAIAACIAGEENAKTRNQIIPQTFTLYLKSLPKLYGGLGPDPEANINLVPKQRRRPKGHEPDAGSVDNDWCTRHGVALALRALSSKGALTTIDIPIVFAFLSSKGLGDVNDTVRAEMVAAAVSVAEAAGEVVGPHTLLPMIEKQLNTPTPNGKDASPELIVQIDRTRENLVVSLGVVASHLPASDSRRVKSADQIIKTAIETPSELVQNAAARCLVPLAAACAHDAAYFEDLRGALTAKLWESHSSYGQRRGSAYALAGLLRGLGIKAIKEFSLIEQVQAAATDKANTRRRHGAFLVMETLAIMYGRLYEPYTVMFLPVMLACMGDGVVEIRDACWAAARASMGDLSSLGVKMILPSLLAGLDDKQWRTRAGAAEVLGAMAFCAPRQLAQCLPQIVPKLASALADAHPKVVLASESAVGRIAAVVRNPEVRNLSRFLLAALRDPANATGGALDAMLGTEFAHAIDPASLALLVPPLHRGLRDRSTDLKKRAAAIVGSMCNHVSNSGDVAPYLNLLLPDLRLTLLDAIPDVRRTSARALGALAIALGENGLPGIVTWLTAALLSGPARGSGVKMRSVLSSAHGDTNALYEEWLTVSVSSSAERSGVAMGLAEVCAALEDSRIEDILKRVLLAGQTSTYAKEGGLMLLAAMPRALCDRFESRLPVALASILQGLADDSDNVREAALDAGRKTVSAYAKTSLETLLPEILAAMRDKLWRIRCAATQLLGDFLLNIAGAFVTVDGSSNVDDVHIKSADGDDANSATVDADNGDDASEEDEEVFDSPEMMAAAMTLESTMKAIEEELGMERRNEVLAALYIIRCDVSVRVRQMGMQVWKSVVSNTPRVLREIMPCAIRQIISSLSDEDDERRTAAGKALGDLSHKLGDRVVPEVLPALHTGITNPEAESRIRLGACEGLAELVLSCPKEQLEAHGSFLLSAVCDALCDSSSNVRSCAARIFGSLLKSLKSTAVGQVVPTLIHLISSGGTGDRAANTSSLDALPDRSSAPDKAIWALEGLKEVLRESGTRLMTIVVPDLLSKVPLTEGACKALAAAVTVSENDFEPFLTDTIDALRATLKEDVSDSSKTSRLSAVDEIVAAITNGSEEFASEFLEKVFAGFNEVSVPHRLVTGKLCISVCSNASIDVLSACAVPLLEVLIRQLTDANCDVVHTVWSSLHSISERMPAGGLSGHIFVIRQALRSAASGVQVGDSSALIPGLNISKGPAPFVIVYTETLLHGSAGLREQAALAIAELGEMCESKVIAAFVIKLMGPLIRVMSDHFPWQVKAAILRAMLVLLRKCALMLRAFAPQMQSTFVKSLSDANRLVRARGCAAVAALAPIQPRLEPLLHDLTALGHNGSLEGARVAGFISCSRIFQSSARLPATVFSTTLQSLIVGLHDDVDSVADAASAAVGMLALRFDNIEHFVRAVNILCKELDSEDIDYVLRARIVRTMGLLCRAGSRLDFVGLKDIEQLENVIVPLMQSSSPPVVSAACSAAVSLYQFFDGPSVRSLTALKRREVVGMFGDIARASPAAEVRVSLLRSLRELVPERPEIVSALAESLITCAGDSNSAIRNSADRVFRRAFISPGQNTVKSKFVEAAKLNLTEEDRAFIDRRVERVMELADIEDDIAEDDE